MKNGESLPWVVHTRKHREKCCAFMFFSSVRSFFFFIFHRFAVAVCIHIPNYGRKNIYNLSWFILCVAWAVCFFFNCVHCIPYVCCQHHILLFFKNTTKIKKMRGEKNGRIKCFYWGTLGHTHTHSLGGRGVWVNIHIYMLLRSIHLFVGSISG